uniref:Methyltransferase small domain-containing protein n=1 Tax=Rhodosorus marinus TaxID=101924 RepID=A0A7S3E7I5_9RHOD|mmetsp:Transcript_14225/g.57269  ORF Transcript_14225/g.57269 Transcript_14225/m.57269 type:complete len:214 (+) Transcript_14225:457-1098(+)|eukprot:CAMPEP_0113957934 /NCGR_PEP_ID=MMETSP0011_2-20120614/3058_1 /TAXON_ID=101924 /ORGANISM="Rhodosorus marinus" /LENGTH=213 /DNA_ID=CAMNT_0000968577 /DNA_START=221 /DNA_END=862 /DNA_ORIENTATION=+ /assembly_acc=CAM_ASM_000156
MRLRELESALSGVKTFSQPKVELEQYPTSAHLAARMLHVAQGSFGDLEDRCVADMGCGGGILAIGACLLGASYVVGFDVDADALEIAASNAHEEEVDIELIQADVQELGVGSSGIMLGNGDIPFDTIIMNPPFGTRQKSIDMAFVRTALSLSRESVYSLHKTSTREYIRRKTREWRVESQVVAEMRFDIPKMYKFHSQQSRDIAVDFWRISKT